MSDNSKYKYEEMSNKVLRQDRKLLSNRADPLKDAALSAPTSLAGKVSLKDLGTRSVEPEAKEENDIAKTITDQVKNKEVKKRQANLKTTRLNNSSLLDSGNVERLKYYPKSQETNEAYESLVSWVSDQFGNDIQHSTAISATDLVLEALKDESFTELQKKKLIEEILDFKIEDLPFSNAIKISNGITDYEEEAQAQGEEAGVAVDFDEEEEGGEQDSEDESDDDFAGPALDDFVQDNDEEEKDQSQEGEEVIRFNQKGTEAHKALSIKDIDAFYLQRLVSSHHTDLDASAVQSLSSGLLELIESSLAGKEFEQRLLQIVDSEKVELVQLLITNREAILWGIKLAKANPEERQSILTALESSESKHLLEDLDDSDESLPISKRRKTDSVNTADVSITRKPKIVNLDDLAFDQGSHLMTTTKVNLPKDSFKRTKKNYEEIHIPAPPKPSDEAELVPISTLPEWAREAFPSAETSTLNRIQSKVYPTAFNKDSNILLCAPTGAGKTNVAMLTILRTLSNYRREDGTFDLNNFKIIYIAPLKALVQEQVREFSRRLEVFGIKVEELTGDSNLTKQQISETQMLVTTPEKWDVITRKNSDTSYTNLVSLLIIDEIHLLHDERGPVLESITARTLRNVEYSGRDVRLVGLSATLPNYEDVSRFLRVDEDEGLFYFDASYRPCPLAQQFIGITEKNSFKKTISMNEACYDKILEAAGKHQVIIFVHSRKDTFRTAKWLRDKLLEEDKLNLFMKSDSASIEILRQESEKVKDTGLAELLPTGFAIHHAGLARDDRSAAEDLFAEGYAQILVSTATLAWGVNLPAHTVIIKGTEVYAPDKGDWTQLSPQDILQMLGRAGRPRYDASGEGIIITSQSEIQYYLAVLNQQLPIESQLMGKLADNLNAEITLGTVKTLQEGIDWLGYTYLYVRMLKSPDIYRVGPEYKDDHYLEWKRADLVHSALTILHQNNLVIYNTADGSIQSTELGRISSHYYISYESMSYYNRQLRSYSSVIDVFRIFSSSSEFKLIPVRQEEKAEINKLIERAPIPIKEDVNDPRAKANVLLQSYISRLSLDGFALNADMIYITQSAGRLLRAIYEIVLKKGWAGLAKYLLDLCKMVEQRIWLSNSPFRQFPDCPPKVIKNTESSNLPWSEYFNLSDPSEVAQAIRDDTSAKKAFDLIKKFPKVTMRCSVQTLTPSLLRFELDVLPEWSWDPQYHNNSESFILLVEDTNGEKILHFDSFLVRRKYINQEHLVDFTVPIDVPIPPNYFVTLISEKWLHCEYRIPVVLNSLKLPKKFPAPTPLLDLHPIPVTDLKIPDFIEAFDFTHFNKFQSQVFSALYQSNENAFVGAVKGSGKTVLAELALLHHWRQNKGRAVYICPSQEKIDLLVQDWKERFGDIGDGKVINKLSNDLSANLKTLAESHVIIATPQQFDVVSRRWKQRRNIQSIELFIADDSQNVGNGAEGSIYENIISRVRFMSSQLESELRIVALSTSLANGRDFGEWIGADKSKIFNFSSKERIRPLEIHLQSYNINHNPSLILAMIKPTYLAIKSFKGAASVVFVPSRKQCVEIGLEFLRLADVDGISFLQAELENAEKLISKVTDETLATLLSNGIGFFYKNMNKTDRKVVEYLFQNDVLSVLFATRDTASFAPSGDLVIVLSTQFYEGKEHRYIDYPINEVLEMIGCSQGAPNQTDKVLILTNSTKRDYYKKFLNESLPVESFLNVFIHDQFLNEISTGLIKSRQDCIDWLTFSYFYRRLQANPSFYGVKDISHVGLSSYLTELVESSLNELAGAKLIELEDNDDEEEEEEDESEEISPLDGALVASYYNVSFITMQTFILSLTRKSKLKSILEIITSASEFDALPIRQHESAILNKIYNRVPIKSSSESNFESPYLKAFVLLQAHFSRLSLPPDLASDQKFVLEKVLTLLYTAVDILSSEGYLNAMYAMDLSQMVVQAVWDTDSPLKQIPYVDNDIIERAQKYKVESVFDIMSIEDEERDDILRLSDRPLNKVAEFVNKYPNIEITYALNKNEPIYSNASKRIQVNVTRDEEPEDLTVSAPFYPFEKSESWWVVLGDSQTRQLYAIKKLSISKEEQQVNLDFTIPKAGHHNLSIWCMCDSYVDADKEVSFEVDVEQGEEDSEEEEEDE
ncbi:pre-mRNA-splicing helicase BRR2 [Wickerhamomyces ciferrii]|uniref:Pre-mRNA-splicing helicase BRR2 n=1 Tax=Wickerhamomyces ciferrii (strain ATCC 14091 / BCRC 22168 / CBS 111 / JCM 3599 / NBRC 0793 / NRRL Y-1031 F-60-10) TaxID=1206466 RepID=K0KLL9_WICCF|nr:pre-mRNA-splicing helicase BRR2 [Wickerhamomyces ciferrii]CCH43112.1 pre-mRNA-splicing helicase BRR2 [Wickerhamomyces ciferrii]